MIKALDKQPRQRRNRIMLAIALIGAIAGVVVAFISLRIENSLLGLPIAFAALGLSLLSLHATRRWWGDVDEAVREAHKTGWYWGGSVGLGVAGGIAALLFTLEPTVSLRQFAVFPGDAGLIATGILLATVLAFIGYGVCWAGWWLKHGR
ncbi:hypothetical protein GVN21_10250 [Caulobacter sp. SLTY]|uniref:hypothetical protein n=1 Tax=Caulobacter sp. SLTY TaxID=2683262 RepID=UPI001412B25E|nr:hypothetical protein [Caulobacter sp. SLTY]NBB15735.1 hypothetical protein [Caulobacter sp. SLTY]